MERDLTIVLVAFAIYLGVGILAWKIGMSTFGGKEKYKDYLKRELNGGPFFYYTIFICFVFLWPFFIRRV